MTSSEINALACRNAVEAGLVASSTEFWSRIRGLLPYTGVEEALHRELLWAHADAGDPEAVDAAWELARDSAPAEIASEMVLISDF